jgi:hypothetical protein
MMNKVVASLGEHRVVIMDSISLVTPENAGDVVVSASHGGLSSAEYGVRHATRGVFFNDAGVGKDNAGIAALEILQGRGIPGATFGHETARIGDVEDTWANGIISHVNRAAETLGLHKGQRVAEAAMVLLNVP